jgi:hypothetical protein
MKLCSDDILAEITAKFAVKPNDFPRGGSFDYPSVIGGWIKQLEANALPYLTAGAIAADGSGHLTMHDREHVARVRQVAANLIAQAGPIDLTPFELTLLLVAIYLHDIGNVLGRNGHERAINRTMKAIGANIGIDQIEYATALQIATAHGGTINGSKDTISTLQTRHAVSNQSVRAQLLAALLRLADELADDPARANKIQLAAGIMPTGAEVFHVVAAGLHSQMPNGEAREICLSFGFGDPTLFKRKLGKNDTSVYLLDEIFNRSLKTYHEARYCSRFTRPILEFERVAVDIMIFNVDHSILHNIKYTIAEHGYGGNEDSIYQMVPELAAYRGNGKLTPEYLRELLDAAGQEQ